MTEWRDEHHDAVIRGWSQLGVARAADELDLKPGAKAEVDLGVGAFIGRLRDPQIEAVWSRGWSHVTKNVLKDPQVRQVLAQKRDGILAGGWSINPPNGATIQEKARTRLIQGWLENLEHHDLLSVLRIMLLGQLYGWSLAEKVLARVAGPRGALWAPVTLNPLPQSQYQFEVDRFGRPERAVFVGQYNASKGPKHPMSRFLYLVFGFDENPYGNNAIDGISFLLWVKGLALRFAAIYAERFGLPFLVATNEKGEQRANWKDGLELLKGIVNSANARAGDVVPAGWKLELLEAAGQGVDIFERVVDSLCDKQIAKAFQIAPLVAGGAEKGGGSYALAGVQQDQMTPTKHLDRLVVQARIQRQLVSPVYRANWGLQGRPPVFLLNQDVQEALQSLVMGTQAIRDLVDRGLPVPVQYVLQLGMIPEAVGGEAVLQPYGGQSTGDTGLDNQLRSMRDVVNAGGEIDPEEMIKLIDAVERAAVRSLDGKKTLISGDAIKETGENFNNGDVKREILHGVQDDVKGGETRGTNRHSDSPGHPDMRATEGDDEEQPRELNERERREELELVDETLVRFAYDGMEDARFTIDQWVADGLAELSEVYDTLDDDAVAEFSLDSEYEEAFAEPLTMSGVKGAFVGAAADAVAWLRTTGTGQRSRVVGGNANKKTGFGARAAAVQRDETVVDRWQDDTWDLAAVISLVDGFDGPLAAAAEVEGWTVLTRADFDKLRAKHQRRALTVAYTERITIEQVFKARLVDALNEGWDFRRFRSEVMAAVEGYRSNHLETVFRTNTGKAFALGKRESQFANEAVVLLEYSAVMDSRTRPDHAALDGLRLPKDDPFWNSHYPPWDFNCRCVVISVFPEDELERTPEDEVPSVEPGFNG